MRHDAILEILRQLIGPAIRFDTSKLNMKSPGYGAAVEWHQDWAFYPHTNSDLCAVGVMMDDCGIENGPLLCIPGSHRGPDPRPPCRRRLLRRDRSRRERLDFSQAVPCTGKAGSISIHHVLTVHGSAVNTSAKPRRLLLYQYSAADAWPLVAAQSAQGLGRMEGAHPLRSVRPHRAADDGGAGAPAAAPPRSSRARSTRPSGRLDTAISQRRGPRPGPRPADPRLARNSGRAAGVVVEVRRGRLRWRTCATTRRRAASSSTSRARSPSPITGGAAAIS